MFIGHYAVALAAKKANPNVSLGTMFLSVQWIDLIWPLLLLLDIEHVRIDPGNTAFTPLDFYDYPFTHSLAAVLGWSLLLGLAYFLIRRNRAGALLVGSGVFSHWLLDFLTHRPDLLLVPGGHIAVGLGLWNAPVIAALVEFSLFTAGFILYSRTTQPLDRIGRYGLWSLCGLLALFWVANILGPPPPSVTVIAVSALGLWLFIPWAVWVDRHRQAVQ
ncbi:MAG: hypothetical protein O2954_17430 [bacterium]|nr:hypothetical protein [bacterium]